jgi:hypothetical protein
MPVETRNLRSEAKPWDPERKTVTHAEDEKPEEKPLELPFLDPLIDTFEKLERLEEDNPRKEELQKFLLQEASSHALHIISEPWYRQRRIRRELDILQNIKPPIYNTTVSYLSKMNNIIATEAEKMRPRRKRTIWRRTRHVAKRLGLSAS